MHNDLKEDFEEKEKEWIKKMMENEKQDDSSEISGIDRDKLIDMIEGYEIKMNTFYFV